jgi:hypothetical protein
MTDLELIKLQCQHYALTDKVLAQRSGLDPQRVLRIRNGYAKASEKEIVAIFDALDNRRKELEKSGIHIHIAGFGQRINGNRETKR